MEELRIEAEELKRIEREVQEQLKRATEAGEEIDEQVNQWLEDVHNVGVTMKTNWLADEKAKSTSTKRLFPLTCQIKKSKKDVLEMKNLVRKLLSQGKNVLCVCFPAETKGIELLWRDNFVEFRSRRSAYDRIMEGLEDEKVGIIGIIGMGGVGKTKLVVEIGKNAKDKKLFSQVVMATVSQSPNIRNIQGMLADMLDLKFKDDTEFGRGNELQRRFQKESKILVILDDVWELIDMERIGIPSQSNYKGSKIILTSRLQKVCEEMDCTFVIRLDVIEEAEALALFNKYAGLQQRPNLKSKAKMIVSECAGLPLAVITVGSALKDKSLEDYEDATRKLSKSSFVDVESVDSDIYACLKLSYDYLEDEDTQRCFILCSLYPEDSEIKVEDLVRCAHGLWLYQNVESVDHARRKVLTSVQQLENACLLSSVSFTDHLYAATSFSCVKMHDMVRDVALWITKLDGLFLVPSCLKEFRRKDVYEKAIGVSLNSWDIDGQFPEELECPKLEILIMRISPTTLPDNFFRQTRYLRVLDISFGTRSKWDNEDNIELLAPVSLQHLVNLKTFHLLGRYMRNSEMSIICKLKNLEILGLSFPISQTVLPEWIGELCNLRVLDLSECYHLELIPCNLISRLSKLEELYTPIHHNTNWSNAFLSDLRFLPCLTVFTGWFMTSRSPIPYWIEKLQDDLRRSRILGLVDLNELPMEVLKQLLPGVEHLEIRKEPTQGIINLFPQLDNSGFQNLRLLHLWSFESLECLIDMTRTASLNNSKVLPNLVELSLCRMQQLRKMCYGHPLNYLGNLRHARIMECPRLVNVVPDILSLAPELEELNISSCGTLKYVYNVETIRAHQLALIPCQLEEQELINEHGDAQLRTMILEAMLRSLISLSKVIISDCHALEEIFPLLEINNEKCDGKLTNLIELRLKGLPELKCVWKGSQLNYCLHKLKTLELYKCDKLSNLLTHTLTQSLSKLQYLSINNCRALETIISQDDQYDALGGLPSSTPQTSFQNIKSIWIESCDKLKSILPMSFVAQGLPKLETMYIKNCPMLEDIFVDSQKNLAKSRDILMKNLTILELVDLPRLVPLSAFNWHLILASLARLKIAGTTFKHASDVLLAVDQGEASNEILPIGVGQSLSYLEVEPDSYFTNVEEVFHVEEAQLPVLTELRALKVGHMPNLKYLWKGPTEFINLCNLSEIEAHSCPEIKSLFTVGISRTLCSLKTLRVYNCKELKNIIEPGDCEAQYLNARCFCELESLYVGNCEMLECVFPVFMVQNFPCLKSLKVEDCPNLENIFHAEMASARRNSMNLEVIPLQQVYNCKELDSISDSIGEEESLSSFSKSSSSDEESVESIYEHSCEELLLETSFEPIAREEYCAPQSNLPHACLPYLKQIQVERCDKLKTLFPLSIAQHLPRLKKVHIKRASQLEQLFIEDREAYEGDKNIMLPKLKMIVLEELPYLISICPPDYVLSCQSFVQLPRVAIENCKMKVIYNLQQNHIAQYCQSVFPNTNTLCQLVNLSYLRHITLNDSKSFPKCIFTHSMVQTLQYLEIIEVFNCMELESIFDPAVDQKATALQQSNSSAVTCLPNLKALLVQGCDRLRTIFPLSVARRLPKLETVYVKRAHQLEEIFSEDLEGHVECKSIELAELKLVHLEEIPFLSQIWPAGYAFISPLFMLELKECPIREPEKLIYLPLVHFENCSVEFLFDLEQVPAQNGQLIHLNLELLWLTNTRNLSCIWKGPTELINLSQLRHIILDDGGSLQMKSIFTCTTAQTLCFLETIKIVNWKELENLIEPSHNEECVALHYINTSATCFPCLRSLQIEGCVRLKNIFPLSVARCLPSLRIVYIKGAHQLEQVFYEDRVEVYLQSKLIEVPQLELLQLLELPCLSRVLPAAYVLTWPPSAVLHLEGCAMVKPKLFPYMHSVHLENCSMEVMFDLEEEVLGHKEPVLVNIQNLWLNHLPNLALILKGPIELIDLSQLRFLRLDKSMALRNSLFTHTLAKTLYSLETLLIFNCDNLESIIASAANEEDSVVLRGASSFSTTFFSCLMCLQLEGCDRLRNIFPLSIAQSLPQLRTVIIIRAYQLEQIFYEDQNEKHVGSKKLIELPELLTLHLEQLPCLSSICPASYSLNCRPSSLHLQIIECRLLDIRKYFPKHPFSLEILNLPTLNMYTRWAPPPPGYVTLNIAGAVNSTQGSAGAGGLLRDMRGYWIKGFSFHLDACTAIKAELQAIKEGLEMTSDSGYNKVILQTSSESVVDLLLGTSDELHPLHHLITICKNMLITYGNVEVRPVQPVEVRLVQHEANNPANWLAFFSFNLETIDTVHIFRSIPRGLRRLIYYDQEGIIYDPSPSYCK